MTLRMTDSPNVYRAMEKLRAAKAETTLGEMNSYDKRLIERLRNWEKVYPEDEDKPEGDLYLEAAERIVELLKDHMDTDG